jgi:hypothetical protein
MKIVLLGLILLVAWNAGFGLLMAGCISALLLIHIGRENTREGNPFGQGRIKLGVGLGFATLAALLFKLVFIFLAWMSLTKLFPALLPSIKELWVQISPF